MKFFNQILSNRVSLLKVNDLQLNQLNKIIFSQKSLALNLSTNFDIKLRSEQILLNLNDTFVN
ncbi:hypothetical protein BpHYR1_014064 [Brachionus plicatilis]|uniref:Uncharacterized protein n=1 Tax=Brachionus plicatilis TaxID=10195 RepID=A0A3M7S114_BRAPC|nr:hypothetical protein BpHYR1_014064 [Brachionus plicatilis]